MKTKSLHSWQLNISQAKEIQLQMATQVSRKDTGIVPRFIAGADISIRKNREIATGAVVVLSYPEMVLVEKQVVEDSLDFPYIPGYLSFREAPLILTACRRLRITPDLLLVDGQGIAHPRRCGLASHLGLFLDIPTIGCAKSLLCGNHEAPGDEPGSIAEIRDNGETIGVALRTKLRVKPIYVSIGHRINLQTAIDWVMKCCHEYRLPEPTRLAHQTAGAIK